MWQTLLHVICTVSSIAFYRIHRYLYLVCITDGQHHVPSWIELNYNLQGTRGVRTVMPLRGCLTQAMWPWSELVRNHFLFLELQITVGYSLVNKVDCNCIWFKMDNQLSTVSKRIEPRSATEFLMDEHGTHVRIHQRLLAFYGEHTGDMSVVHRWVRKSMASSSYSSIFWLVGSFPSGMVASHSFHCCITVSSCVSGDLL